jgi:hypothetical protein
MIGVTFDDIDINQNGVEEFAVEGNLSLNVINGATPVLIRQSFRDTQLPSIASRIQRFNTTGSLTLNQRFIFGNKSDITSSSASFSVGDDFQTIDYTNNTFNTPNAIYRAGTAIEYDDSLTPTYYFDEGVERITKVEEISFAATTAAPTTTTAAPTTTTAPSEPVIFTSESPVDGGNIVVGSVRQPVSEFNVGLANNVPSGMEFRIRVETSNLINVDTIGVENFVDSQNVPIKTTYVNNDLVTQDNVSSGNILYTYDPVITKTVETEVTTGTLAFVIETNINGSFQETDRISYDLSVFTIRAVPTCPNDTNILEFVSNSTNDFQLIFTDDVNYTLGDFNIEANAVEVLQFNPSTTPILLVEDTNTTLIVNVSDANLPAGTYDINVSFTNFACGTYVRTRRITVEEGNFEDGGRGNPLI